MARVSPEVNYKRVVKSLDALRLLEVDSRWPVEVVGDGGEPYSWEWRGVTGARPGTYADNGSTIIVPTGGDGSEAWLSGGRDAVRSALEVDASGLAGQNGLPNESGFWWTTQPKQIGGKVYTSTCGDKNDVYLNVYADNAGVKWLRRYFLGYVGNTTTIDDHQGGGVAVRAGKPLVVIWGGHNYDSVVYYKATLKNIDDYLDGEDLTFGPTRTYSLGAGSNQSYVIMLLRDGDDDIRFMHRTGPEALTWSITTLPDWATGTPATVDLFTSAGQYYVTARVNGNTVKCVASDHPSLGVENTLKYALINLTTGAVTTSGGTVLGNLDGTNLPLSHSSLETVFTGAGSSKPWGFDVSVGADHSCIFVDGRLPLNFASSAKYKFARLVSGSWVVNDIDNVGSFLGGAYFPSIVADPHDTNAVYLVRESGGTARLERCVTANNGAAWTVSTIEAMSTAETTLCRCYSVEAVDGAARAFDVLVTEIDEYPTYNEPWICRVRPAPAGSLKRLPDIDVSTVEAPTGALHLPGTAGTYITAPNASLGALVDGLRMEVVAALDDWTSGAPQVLMAKEESASKRSFYFFVNGDGKIGIGYSADGTTGYQVISNNLPPQVNAEYLHLAAEFTPRFNATQLYLSLQYRLNDNEGWISLDEIKVVPSAINPGAPFSALYDSNSVLEVGSRWLGTQGRATGKFRRAALMTLGRSVVSEWRADIVGAGAAIADAVGTVWTLTKPAQVYSSAFDGALFAKGSYREWYGPDNEQRFKAAVPSSNTDGYTPRSIFGRTTLTSSGTSLVRDDFVVLNGSGPITYTLPATTSMSSAGLTTKAIEVVNIAASTATLAPNSGQTINGSASSISLTQWTARQVRYLGSGAWVAY